MDGSISSIIPLKSYDQDGDLWEEVYMRVKSKRHTQQSVSIMIACQGMPIWYRCGTPGDPWHWSGWIYEQIPYRRNQSCRIAEKLAPWTARLGRPRRTPARRTRVSLSCVRSLAPQRISCVLALRLRIERHAEHLSSVAPTYKTLG